MKYLLLNPLNSFPRVTSSLLVIVRTLLVRMFIQLNHIVLSASCWERVFSGKQACFVSGRVRRY